MKYIILLLLFIGCTKDSTVDRYDLVANCYGQPPYDASDCFRPSSYPIIDHYALVGTESITFVNDITGYEFKEDYHDGFIELNGRSIDGHTFNNFIQEYKFDGNTMKIIDPRLTPSDFFLYYVKQN